MADFILGGDFIENKETALFNQTTLPQMPIYSRTGTIC